MNNKGGSNCYRGRLVKAGDKFRVIRKSFETESRINDKWIGKILTIEKVEIGSSAPITLLKEPGIWFHMWDKIDIEFIAEVENIKPVRSKSRLEDLIL